MPRERIQHPSLWFDDGNVVLSAKTKSTETREMLFRVHKGVLSRHSQVFAGMFTLPEVPIHQEDTTTDPNEMHDGVPLVIMPDTVEQIECMLNVFYDPLYLKLETRDLDLPLRLTPLMTVVRKYELDTIGAYIVKRMRAQWPANLEEWDDVDREVKSYPSNTLLEAWPDTFLPEPISSINFARQFDVKDVPVAAFYDLSRCYYNESWPGPETKPIFNPERKGARWSLLSAQDFLRLGQLKETLENCLSTFTNESASHLMDPGCSEHTTQKDKMALEVIREEIASESLMSRDILRMLRHYTDGKFLESQGLCPKCSQTLAKKIRSLRIIIWGSIASIVYRKVTD